MDARSDLSRGRACLLLFDDFGRGGGTSCSSSDRVGKSGGSGDWSSMSEDHTTVRREVLAIGKRGAVTRTSQGVEEAEWGEKRETHCSLRRGRETARPSRLKHKVTGPRVRIVDFGQDAVELTRAPSNRSMRDGSTEGQCTLPQHHARQLTEQYARLRHGTAPPFVRVRAPRRGVARELRSHRPIGTIGSCHRLLVHIPK